MKQFIASAVVALFVMCGAMFISQTCFAAAPQSVPQVTPSTSYGPIAQTPAYNFNYNNYSNYNANYNNYPSYGAQTRKGYTRGEIRSMPITARPNRFGHFIGNTVRRRAGVGY